MRGCRDQTVPFADVAVPLPAHTGIDGHPGAEPPGVAEIEGIDVVFPVEGLFGGDERWICPAAHVKLCVGSIQDPGQIGQDVGGPVSVSGADTSGKLGTAKYETVGRVRSDCIGGGHIEAGKGEVADVLPLKAEPEGVIPPGPAGVVGVIPGSGVTTLPFSVAVPFRVRVRSGHDLEAPLLQKIPLIGKHDTGNVAAKPNFVNETGGGCPVPGGGKEVGCRERLGKGLLKTRQEVGAVVLEIIVAIDALKGVRIVEDVVKPEAVLIPVFVAGEVVAMARCVETVSPGRIIADGCRCDLSRHEGIGRGAAQGKQLNTL